MEKPSGTIVGHIYGSNEGDLIQFHEKELAARDAAIRREALEEAARVAEKTMVDHEEPVYFMVIEDVKNNIRALAKAGKEKP